VDADVDLADEFTDLDINAGSDSGWSDNDRLVLQACIGVVKTAATAIRQVLNKFSVHVLLLLHYPCLTASFPRRLTPRWPV